jgi:hypothetical protein
MMELEFTTGLINFAAAVLTFGAVAFRFFKKFSDVPEAGTSLI